MDCYVKSVNLFFLFNCLMIILIFIIITSYYLLLCWIQTYMRQCLLRNFHPRVKKTTVLEPKLSSKCLSGLWQYPGDRGWHVDCPEYAHASMHIAMALLYSVFSSSQPHLERRRNMDWRASLARLEIFLGVLPAFSLLLPAFVVEHPISSTSTCSTGIFIFSRFLA